MKDDPLRLQLRKELRELRRGEGALAPDRIAICEALVRVVGMGSVEQARGTLREMLSRYAGELHGDIRAYLETCGVGIDGATLERRLEAYAATHHVDQRTALRRSDRGADKLATLFRDEELFFRPWGHLTMYQFGERVLCTITLNMDPNSEYRAPAVWVHDELLDDLEFEFGPPHPRTGYVQAKQHFDSFRLDRERDWLFKIDIEWRMGVWPQWVLATQLADPRLVAKVQTQRNYMTEATITWGAWPQREMDTDGPFAAFPTLDSTTRIHPSEHASGSSQQSSLTQAQHH